MPALPQLTSAVITCNMWTMHWRLVGRTSLSGSLCKKLLQELLDKHTGANAAVYGELGYLVLFATAADAVSVFAPITFVKTQGWSR